MHNTTLKLFQGGPHHIKTSSLICWTIYAHIFTNSFYDKPNQTINTMGLITRLLELWGSVVGCALWNAEKLLRIRITEKQETGNRILLVRQ